MSDLKNDFMNKTKLILALSALILSYAANAQARVFMAPGWGYGYSMHPRYYPSQRDKQNQNSQLPKFEPSIDISIGYGFPNLDKYQLPVFFNYYSGNVQQTGPVTGSIDYRFSRNMSVGLMITHGSVSAPYYDYNSGAQTFTGSLNNWSFMFNMMHYIPVYSNKASPYFRTAIGINTWEQSFTDNSGNKLNMQGNPSDLAYQVSFGADFMLSKNARFFMEGGYGKYILQAGMKFKF
jgi:hypothetical protein